MLELRSKSADYNCLLVVGHGTLYDPRSAVEWMRWVGTQTALGFLPFALGVTGLALAVGAVQGRGTLTLKPLQPDWSRLSPVKNAQRFLTPRPLVDLGKALFKLIVVGAVVYVALSGGMAELSRLAQSGPPALVRRCNA